MMEENGHRRSACRKTPNQPGCTPKFWNVVNKSPLTRVRIIGRAAENLTIWYLRQRGWRILSHNYASRHGEIDIIAYRHGADLPDYPTIAFVEVKCRTRSDVLAPALSVSSAKRRKINATIRDWIGLHPRLKAVYRRDIASVWIERRRLPSIRYFPAAFTDGDPYGW